MKFIDNKIIDNKILGEVLFSIKNYGVTFYKSGDRPTARFVFGTTVYEECIDNGRFIGLYWSAGGHIHRENVTNVFPEGINAVSHPISSFELEIDV